MRRTISLLVLCFFGLSGCQGIGGYSAQSVTRVPPIGTNSYQVPGNYYGNAAPAPMTGASMNGASMNGASTTGGGIAPASGPLPSTASYNGSTGGLSDVTTAQFNMPSTAVGSGVSNASALSTSGGDSGQLQWQR